MARGSEQERAAVQTLVRRIYTAVGAGVWADVARLAGVSEYSLGEWRRGEGSPSALNLLKLLRAAGVLGSNFELPEQPAARPRNPEGELLIAEVAQMIDESHQDLTTRLDRIERAIGHAQQPATPPQGGGRRARGGG